MSNLIAMTVADPTKQKDLLAIGAVFAVLCLGHMFSGKSKGGALLFVLVVGAIALYATMGAPGSTVAPVKRRNVRLMARWALATAVVVISANYVAANGWPL